MPAARFVEPFSPGADRRVMAAATYPEPSARGAGASDADLVTRAQAGDDRAFSALADRYSPRLRRVLFGVTRDCDAAWDAVQEALVRAWQNIGRFEGRSRFYTWLTRIGLNEAYRRVPSRPEQSLEVYDAVGERIPDWGNQPDEVFESRDFLAAVDRALAELPDDYRVAVILRDVEGLSTTEAAQVLGVGERALKSRLHRGRLALRAKLDDHFTEAAV